MHSLELCHKMRPLPDFSSTSWLLVILLFSIQRNCASSLFSLGYNLPLLPRSRATTTLIMCDPSRNLDCCFFPEIPILSALQVHTLCESGCLLATSDSPSLHACLFSPPSSPQIIIQPAFTHRSSSALPPGSLLLRTGREREREREVPAPNRLRPNPRARNKLGHSALGLKWTLTSLALAIKTSSYLKPKLHKSNHLTNNSTK